MGHATLRLRGGGADLKRKEARKRKFADLEAIGGESAPKKVDNNQTVGDQAILSESVAISPLEQPEKNNSTSGEGLTSVKPQRFICFVGNLPFSANTDSITQHFSKVQPCAVRHRTVKETGKSKGFAFVEFDRYDYMKTCLQLYHHSNFDDGISPVRKINVELTAGGGGTKSKARRSKLLSKNEKLNEERKRRLQGENEQDPKPIQTLPKTPPAKEVEVIHPSRRNRISNG